MSDIIRNILPRKKAHSSGEAKAHDGRSAARSMQDILQVYKLKQLMRDVSNLATKKSPGASDANIASKLNGLSFQTKARLGASLFDRFTTTARRFLRAELKECMLPDGKIVFWKTKSKKPETIVFLHGFGDSSDSAYLLAFHLASRFNLIVPDLPGFGRSFKREDISYEQRNYERWLVSFLESVTDGPVHLVGNSLGGAFCLLLAEARPELIQSVTLLNTGAITDFETHSVYDEFLSGKSFFQVRTIEDFDRFISRVFYRKPFSPPGFREYLCTQFQDNYTWYGHLVKAIFGDVRDKNDPRYAEIFFNERIKHLRVPCLIIWGDKDSVFPLKFGELAHRLLHDSKLVVLPNVGHAPHIEVPQRVSSLIKRFIAEQTRGHNERPLTSKAIKIIETVKA